jgi:hypothetical protein
MSDLTTISLHAVFICIFVRNILCLKYAGSMVFRDHLPPHFHVEYAEHKAKISIADAEIIDGSLPRKALRRTGLGGNTQG